MGFQQGHPADQWSRPKQRRREFLEDHPTWMSRWKLGSMLSKWDNNLLINGVS